MSEFITGYILEVMLKEISEVEFWDEIYDKAARERIPLKASFELTYQCNLRCRHCYIPRSKRIETRSKRQEKLSYSEVCSILDQLAEMHCFHLELTGGEPFMRPNIFKILDYARRKGFYTILLTNGTLITTEVANQLKDLSINQVDISLYGVTQKTYESITQILGSFHRCIQGIRLLKERNIPICLKLPVMTLNIGEFSQVKAFAKKLGARFQYTYFINPKIDGSKEPLEFRLSPEEGISLEMRNQPHLFEDEKRSRKDRVNSLKRNDGLFYCNAGRNSLAITPYGEMNLCLEYHFPGYDLRRGNLSEGWKELLDYAKLAEPTTTYQCGDCELREFCQWCPSVGWLEKGDRGACSPYYKELARMKRDRVKEMSKVKADKDDLSKPIREVFIEQLRKGNSIRMIIRGRSMHSFIRKSDMVTVKPIRFEEAKVGDIVAYARNFHHGFTVHRLIKRSRDHQGREYLASKGDASRYGDPPVYPEEVYGKVVMIERRDGRIIHLDTRYRRLQGYLLARRSWLVGVLRMLLKSPHVVPVKITCKIKNLCSK